MFGQILHVLTSIADMTVNAFNDLISNGAGGVLLLVPSPEKSASLSKEVKESVSLLEEHLQSQEWEIPVYFAEETEQLLELLESLGGDVGSKEKETAIQALMGSLGSYGYQLVSSSSAVPKPITDPNLISIEAALRGTHGEENGNDAQPTIVMVAHYDTNSLAGSMPKTGMDSNGSGVVVLMELARIFGKLYSSSRTRPNMGLVFLLSSGGKLNYFGTKKWLERHLDHDSQSELLADVSFAVCLDTLSGKDMNIHVSKPPKEDTPAAKFISKLKSTRNSEMIHKKINLAEDLLAWEHERFSIRRLPAMTLSRLSEADSGERSSVLDSEISTEALGKQVKSIGEALACAVYNYNMEGCSGNILTGSLSPSSDSMQSWIGHLKDNPRFPGLLVDKKNDFVKTMVDGMKSYVGASNVKEIGAKRETREPEFVLYDFPQTTITAYR